MSYVDEGNVQKGNVLLVNDQFQKRNNEVINSYKGYITEKHSLMLKDEEKNAKIFR